MRPYSQRTLDNVKRIFNYRLSRGRKTVECGFGMMSEKFQVLNSPTRAHISNRVTDIIKCVCILHNFIRKKGVQYIPNEQFGKSQIDIDNTTLLPLQDCVLHEPATPNKVRNYLANYFLTPRASISWQWKYSV